MYNAAMNGTDSPPHTKAAVLGILRAADALRRRLAALLEPHGLTPQQFNVLRILRGARPDGLCTLAVAGRMMEQAPGITRLLDRLEAKGFVARQRSTEDRREVRVRITPQGLEVLARLDKPVGDLDRAAVARLTKLDQQQLASLLAAVHREPE
jgi:DNA-binding MarR family transcriptional regulator